MLNTIKMLNNFIHVTFLSLILQSICFSQQISKRDAENDSTAVVVVVVFDVNTKGKISNVSIDKIKNCSSCSRKTKKYLARKAVKTIKNIKSFEPGGKRIRVKQPIKFEILEFKG